MSKLIQCSGVPDYVNMLRYQIGLSIDDSLAVLSVGILSISDIVVCEGEIRALHSDQRLTDAGLAKLSKQFVVVT